MIDLRSDTVTKPSQAMLKAMASAEVGDDVFGEDPSIIALENIVAERFGMEAAIYCPSGTMTNQIAIKCHTQPGDEVVCEQLSHIYRYEGGGIAFNSGCQVHLVQGDRGRITAAQVKSAINPVDDHKSHTALVSLENTANRGGGSCYDFDEILAIGQVCKANGLKFHLDGARLFNAIVAKKESPLQYGKAFDSISVCLSKGLGCPVGSVLIGPREMITRARRIRKVFGGGMRQAGYLAAAGIYAMEHNIERLAEDHYKARCVAETLQSKEFTAHILPVETNIIIFEPRGKYTASTLAAALAEKGILAIAISATQVRMVFHLDITDQMVEKIRETIHLL